jgi:transposase
VGNDEAGWAELIAWLAADPPDVLVLEATGRYEIGVVVALDRAGMTPVVLNPLAVRRFAQSMGRRAKTDRLDAAILAEYGARLRPTPRPIPADIARNLRDLLARHRQLSDMLVMEKNRLKQATAVVRPSVKSTIAYLEQELAATDLLLASVVASDPEWQAKVDRLDTAPGIGPYLATCLAVELAELGTLTRKQAAALVGVAPYAQDSGRATGRRQISGGRKAVRTALYQGTVTAIRCHPLLRAQFQHLIAAGKPPQVARIACARRFLGLLNAMMREHLTWPELSVHHAPLLGQIA